MSKPDQVSDLHARVEKRWLQPQQRESWKRKFANWHNDPEKDAGWSRAYANKPELALESALHDLELAEAEVKELRAEQEALQIEISKHLTTSERDLIPNIRNLAQRAITWRDNCKAAEAEADTLRAELARPANHIRIENAELHAGIEAAEAELTRLRAENRWIPVGERLPKIGVLVHTYNRTLGVRTAELLTGHNDSLRWLYQDGGGDPFEVNKVWRPLPSPPVAEREKEK